MNSPESQSKAERPDAPTAYVYNKKSSAII